jgi:hypothetical protein
MILHVIVRKNAVYHLSREDACGAIEDGNMVTINFSRHATPILVLNHRRKGVYSNGQDWVSIVAKIGYVFECELL